MTNNINVERTDNVVEISSSGPQGPRGKGLIHGSGVPSNLIGIDGEFYIDTDVNKMYGPKQSGNWGDPVNLGGTYVHVQGVASDTWTINHNLDFYPSVEIVDSAGNDVVGNYQFINTNVITATFNYPFSGKAYLS